MSTIDDFASSTTNTVRIMSCIAEPHLGRPLTDDELMTLYLRCMADVGDADRVHATVLRFVADLLDPTPNKPLK